MLMSDSEFAKMIVEKSFFLILTAAGLGVLTVVFDYLQFLSGYVAVNAALKNSENQYSYSKSWLSYKFRGWFFRLKQLTAFLGSILVIITIYKSYGS